ncbi:peptide deformylase [Candidatus Gottesmanbacteria bacterium RIFCSPHIGHO2_02_FULL_40_13]|uniref:Peptide deformylase n=1 Tax=Candidatus Gottesmanbacteria bacterium RIFCSPHIGHO2_02_FULL_40_13 TaxID=1798384 RepID=A0A1F6A5F7_9BACT|nr:MAG: peptide deformylase [Candidatus Gottesmanbacteria bacterium RIFCSPHIGHO2_02_FULL_40_13]OGL34642.1 MAG: peptide deformylase [Candidatus Saccharibacteria bacterium RIFCSPHIGHO2_12_FULL_47_17]
MSTRKILRRREFGDPILRAEARELSRQNILSKQTKQLIADMRYTLAKKKYGVGLAAPQVGQSIALAIIEIKSTKTRPRLPKHKWASLALINPKIVRFYGQRQQLYEGCISFAEAFAKVPRYKKIRVRYFDEKAKTHEKNFDGLLAHVIQHEIDHLNGVLFVDRVKDKASFITQSEYIKRMAKAKKE